MNFKIASILLICFFALNTVSKANSISWFPDSNLGKKSDHNRIRLSLLNRPIELDSKKLEVIGKLNVNTQSQKAKDYYGQGLFELFTFNYVDAVRSFKMAIDADPEFFQAYIAITDGYVQIEGEDNIPAAILKASEVASKTRISEADKLWLELAKVNACKLSKDYCLILGVSDLSDRKKIAKNITEAAFKENNLNLIVLIEMYFLGTSKNLEAVLQKQTNLVGAKHLLVHYYENTGDYPKALSNAKDLATLAPMSAHAQHMYGHILPKMGRWNEAIEQFKLADQIHEQWFEKNSATPEEEWHYPHNLDLMAHALNWDRDFNGAESNWKKTCDLFEGHYCTTYALFLIAQKKLDLAATVISKNSISNLENMKLMIKLVNDPNNKTIQNEIQSVAKTNHPKSSLVVISNIIRSLNQPDLQKEIVAHIESSISASGFDTWSKNVLQADVYITIAEQLGLKALAAEIKVAKMNVGFVCRSNSKP